MTTTQPRTLGTCYYPEHWDRSIWEDDAQRMVEAGLSWVRIGEFAWSRIEPREGEFHWDWLDDAIEILGRAGLKVVLGTPTATPPKWVLNKYPDMLAIDAQGQPRKFGSRRHYCFSHLPYRAEAGRITRDLAERYGSNNFIHAWQTDNEYGCHDTVVSYSDAARSGFQNWLAARYGDITALNKAWGNVFWSMEYDDFSEIDLPNLTVTEPSHIHQLDFMRYSSDMVVAFNKVQTDILRAHTDAPLIHNYMGRIVEFDHFGVGADLDIASWDSYPIGFLSDRLEASDAHKQHFLRQGDPDFQAFHHDLYRAVGRGRMWIMEQQPGPVNWAPYNPAPLDGMARLWAWEAFAHGAETVCYFRWRQAPFAQEQMHAGLLHPDSTDAPALSEARQVANEIKAMPDAKTAKGDVAIIFDYASAWAWFAQPQGADFDYFRLVFDTYRALRRAGQNVDILPPDAPSLDGYSAVFAPGLMTIPDGLRKILQSTETPIILGPRTDTKDINLAIPTPMGPNVEGLDATVRITESIPPTAKFDLKGGGTARHWFEHITGDAETYIETIDNQPVLVGSNGLFYLGAWLDEAGFDRVIQMFVTPHKMPAGVRVRDTDTHRFWFNYNPHSVTIDGNEIPTAGVTWQKL